ncbi:hypothetical protein HanHA89_Chr15g0597901 [Helianthus annuus]|nr:hypothetical protein HanHA89_Chr15g0597901 [Helianthus annuus]
MATLKIGSHYSHTPKILFSHSYVYTIHIELYKSYRRILHKKMSKNGFLSPCIRAV